MNEELFDRSGANSTTWELKTKSQYSSVVESQLESFIIETIFF
jgi:hypothetical protein